MNDPSVQLNIRAPRSVAQAVRARARERGLSLSEVLRELLDAGRAASGDGVLLRLDAPAGAALRALAAAERRSEQAILTELLEGTLRDRLLALAGELGRAPARPEAATRADDEGDTEVGLFTVFD